VDCTVGLLVWKLGDWGDLFGEEEGSVCTREVVEKQNNGGILGGETMKK
jgi:hypothetical protein